MEKIELGGTGLKVSLAGLGAGGFSRLGLRQSKAQAARVIETALDLGVNLIDTARAYGTEEVIGETLKAKGAAGEKIILASKALPVLLSGEVITPARLKISVEKSLRRLQRDRLDIFFLHGVPPRHYAAVREKLYPALQQMQQHGLIRFCGVTEYFEGDTSHTMLQSALADKCWDVIMIGHNFLNASAAPLLAQAKADKTGTLTMFAVRHALASAANFRHAYAGWEAKRILPPKLKTAGAGALDFLGADFADTAYRYCRHTPNAEVILTGTGNPAHLRANLASIAAPPLPPETRARLESLFAGWDQVSGNPP